MRKLAAGISLVALLMLLTACGGGGGGSRPKPVYPATINISGDLELNGATYVRGNLSECAGAAIYADLAAGAPVTVSNRAGVPLAVGAIQYAVGTNVYQNQLDQCTFRFLVFNVPRSAAYQVDIARQDPVPVTFLELLNSGGTMGVALPHPASFYATSTTTITEAPATGRSGRTNRAPGG